MQIQLRSTVERVKDSQFLIPALFIMASLLLVIVTADLDDRSADSVIPITSSIAATRTLLATVAGAIVTVAALVFSLSAVTMQLAASQYSPRTLQVFSRDREQQVAIGLAMGTFTYALGALATLPADPESMLHANWTAAAAIILAVLTVLVIVSYIDHVTRRVRIDDTTQRIAEATLATFARQRDLAALPTDPWDPSDLGMGRAVRATETGFVQAIDLAGLVEQIPPGSIVRLDVWTGHFVTEGRRIATLWGEENLIPADALVEPIAIGPQRTIEQDPGFGIRSLVDIALRALSPGINDPATASDAVRQLAGCIRAAYLAGDRGRVFAGADGARLFTPHAPAPADHLAAAFPPIRRSAADQPLVMDAIADALGALDDELSERGIDSRLLRNEADAARLRWQELEVSPGEPLAAETPPTAGGDSRTGS